MHEMPYKPFMGVNHLSLPYILYYCAVHVLLADESTDPFIWLLLKAWPECTHRATLTTLYYNNVEYVLIDNLSEQVKLPSDPALPPQQVYWGYFYDQPLRLGQT